MIKAIDLSNYVILSAQKTGIPITHLKLQKILYYIQGVYIAQYSIPLFSENIEAWPYGPVVREVYLKYVSNGALCLKPDPKSILPDMTVQEKECVDSVLRDKLNYSASSLVGATHNETPWLEHAKEVENGLKPVISVDSIYRYFSGVKK